jgi:hypothetical protein
VTPKALLVIAGVLCFVISYAIDGTHPWDTCLLDASLGFFVLSIARGERR